MTPRDNQSLESHNFSDTPNSEKEFPSSVEQADSTLLGLPSWVPDWTNIENDRPFTRYVPRIPFNAAPHKFDPSLNAIVDENNNLLVTGMRADRIKTIGMIPRFTMTPLNRRWNHEDSISHQEKKRWFLECRILSQSIFSDYEDFWKTMTCDLTGDGFKAPSQYATFFANYVKFLDSEPKLGRVVRDKHYSINFGDKSIPLIESSLYMWASRRRFAVTDGGRLAFVPQQTREGDSVIILCGSPVPYILRECHFKERSFHVVGEAYVHGLMYGEQVNVDAKTLSAKQIQLKIS